MSFTEMLEGVKLMTLEEKWQLHQAVAREINDIGSLMDSFRPGMVAYMTPKLTIDEAGLRAMYGVAEPKESE